MSVSTQVSAILSSSTRQMTKEVESISAPVGSIPTNSPVCVPWKRWRIAILSPSTIEDSIVEGDKIAMRQRFQGTHRGEFVGIEPTGAEIDSTSFVVCRVEDDKIAETWVETDMLGLLEQLGRDVRPDSG